MKRPTVIHRQAAAPLPRGRGVRRCGTPARGSLHCGSLPGGSLPGGPLHCGSLPGGARSPERGRAARRPAPCCAAPPLGQLPELVFAAVRPGFVAACMVIAAADGDGRRFGPDGHAGDGGRRPGRPVRKRRVAPWPHPARARPRGGARAHGGTLFNERALRYRTGQNRQMAYFAGQEAGLPGGVRRDTAIIPRDCADARDLRLTTLSNDSCV
jgi:hypothetical protein